MGPRNIKFVRIGLVIKKFGIGRSTAYRFAAIGLLPPQVKLGRRASGFPEHEIDAVAEARLAGEGDDAVRALVNRLVEERRQPGAARQTVVQVDISGGVDHNPIAEAVDEAN